MENGIVYCSILAFLLNSPSLPLDLVNFSLQFRIQCWGRVRLSNGALGLNVYGNFPDHRAFMFASRIIPPVGDEIAAAIPHCEKTEVLKACCDRRHLKRGREPIDKLSNAFFGVFTGATIPSDPSTS